MVVFFKNTSLEATTRISPSTVLREFFGHILNRRPASCSDVVPMKTSDIVLQKYSQTGSVGTHVDALIARMQSCLNVKQSAVSCNLQF